MFISGINQCGRIKMMHKWWQGPWKQSLAGSENESFKYFDINSNTIERQIHQVILP